MTTDKAALEKARDELEGHHPDVIKSVQIIMRLPDAVMNVDDKILIVNALTRPQDTAWIEGVERALKSARNRIEYLTGFCDLRHEDENEHIYHLIEAALEAVAQKMKG